MLAKLKDHLYQRTKHDFVVVLIFGFIGFGLSSYFDLFERLYHFSRHYEHLELDEFLPAVLFTLVGLSYFSFRRWKDVSVLSSYLETLTLTCSNFNIANRRALKQLLIQNAKKPDDAHTFILISIDGLERIRLQQGFVVVELVLSELLEALCTQLVDEQLLISWQTGQFIIHVPNGDSEYVSELKHQLKKSCVLSQPTLQKQLRILTASVTVKGSLTEEALFESLEEQLLDSPAKAA